MKRVVEIMPPELRLKKVVTSTPEGDGLGHHVTLDCGHSTWHATPLEPGQHVHCGRCVDLYHQKVLPTFPRD